MLDSLFKVRWPGTCLWRVLEEKISQWEGRAPFLSSSSGVCVDEVRPPCSAACRLLRRCCAVQTDRVRERRVAGPGSSPRASFSPSDHSDDLSAGVGKRNRTRRSLGTSEKQTAFGNVFYSTCGSCKKKKKTLNGTDTTKCLVSTSESPSSGLEALLAFGAPLPGMFPSAFKSINMHLEIHLVGVFTQMGLCYFCVSLCITYSFI